MLHAAFITITEDGPDLNFKSAPHEYDTFHDFVGGDFKILSVVESTELAIIMNKEGKERLLPVSYIGLPEGSMQLFGNYLIVGINRESGCLESLNNQDIQWICENCQFREAETNLTPTRLPL